MNEILTCSMIEEAYMRLKSVVNLTPLELSQRLSEKYGAQIYLKREDQQVVRSYKIRGAYNKIFLLSKKERAGGVVCASAGNHAQGVAFSCSKLKVQGHIYMPKNTTRQKVDRVNSLGGEWITLELVGDTFDDAYEVAKEFCAIKKKTFIHPFNDVLVMAGQGTVGVEIVNQFKKIPDYIIVPVGGGGLLAGLSTYLKSFSEKVKIVGAEPLGAPSMTEALDKKPNSQHRKNR